MIYQFIHQEQPPILKGHLNIGGQNKTTSIQVNSRYFERNGECWIPIMGEIHFSRLARSEWKRELLKMKAGGITSVSVYVIWIYHEEREGVFNFEGNRDLKAFVQLVKECGLEMVLRIGPWIHGEVRNGGFPDWLMEKGCTLRKNDSQYLALVKRYWQQIYLQVKDFLFENEGPIWAIQLENELTDGADHLLALKHLAKEVGLNAPIYTVTGWNAAFGAEIPETEVVPVFGGYAEAPWTGHTHALEPCSHYFFLPDRNDSAIGADLLVKNKEEKSDVFRMKYEWYPFATCELGGGIQVTHHRRPIIQGDDVAAVSLVALGCGNNLPGYYMYHGGTNAIGELSTLQESKATGYPNDLPVKSYDFQAPLGEYGQVRDQFAKFRMQHLFLDSFGKEFGKMDAFFAKTQPEGRHDTACLRYSMRTNGKQGFVFFNNYQRICEMPPHADVQFEVPVENGSMIFPKNPIAIAPNTYGFFPYQMPLNGVVLDYATAQPLAQKGDTWFFAAHKGIEPEYCIDGKCYPASAKDVDVLTIDTANGKCRIVTLSPQQALRFCKVGQDYYLADGVLTEQDGQLMLEWTGNEAVVERWEESGFSCVKKFEVQPPEVTVECCEQPCSLVYPQGADEVALSGDAAHKLWQLTVSMPESFGQAEDVLLDIRYTGDLAQLYLAQTLVADDYNRGTAWQISMKAVQQDKKDNDATKTLLELLITENIGNPVYTESEGAAKKGLELLELCPTFIYRKAVL